jgi:NADH-quinone oxidoreductase subunit L
MAALLIFLTIGLPWLGALLVWAAGFRKSPPAATARLQNGLAAGFSVAAGLAALALLPLAGPSAVVRIPMGAFFGDLTFVADGLGVFLAAIATVVGSLAVIFSIDYMHGETQLGRYYFLVLFFIGAMAGLALTGSLMFLFVFWEITALCSYALISFYNDDPKAVAGGIKALIITQLGGIGLLVGALLAYSYTGSYEINVLLEKAHNLPAAILALMAFGALIAAAAKSAQVPLHTWLPDAMEAPTPVSALIHAATMVNAGVYLLARFYPAFEAVPYWKTAVILVGAITALLAALMAAVANDLKRVLAYSTVSQLGYMVYAIGAGSVFASQFHLLSHALFKALLFLGAGAVIHTLGTRDMRQMGAQNVRMPIVRAVFIIGALALAGLPILNGFWSKELIMEAGLEGGPTWAYLLILTGAGITAFYTFRMVWMVFFAPLPSTPDIHIHDAPLAMRTALLPLAFATLTSWLLAGPLGELLETTLPYHELETPTTWQMVVEVLTAPATWLALGVIFLGLAAWRYRQNLEWAGKLLATPAKWASQGFGFEKLNGWVVRKTLEAADSLRPLQTGWLNWNLVGLLGGLLIVLAWLAWSI